MTGVRGAGKTYPVHEHLLNKYFKIEVLKEIKEELRLIAQIISYATGQGEIK